MKYTSALQLKINGAIATSKPADFVRRSRRTESQVFHTGVWATIGGIITFLFLIVGISTFFYGVGLVVGA